MPAEPHTVPGALPVNEIFETIQGEASWTGSPAVFIRLQGCGVGCPWCDTRHTWAIDDPESEVTLSTMLGKLDDSPQYARVGPSTLLAIIGHFRARHIVITGGEPCIHDLTDLTAHLIEKGRTVQIETSGTEPIRCDPRTWVTVSPKIGMPGGKAVQAEALQRADEIKIPVGKLADVERFRDFWKNAMNGRSRDIPIWLQPLSQNRKATELCIEAATEHGYRISLQTHKFIGAR